jgi:hypothetical protein
VPGIAGRRLGHGGMNGKDIDQAREGKNAQYLLPRRSERSRDACRLCDVEHPTQRDDNSDPR